MMELKFRGGMMKKTLLTIIVSAICIIGLNYTNAKHGIDAVIIVGFSIIIALTEMKEVE